MDAIDHEAGLAIEERAEDQPEWEDDEEDPFAGIPDLPHEAEFNL